MSTSPHSKSASVKKDYTYTSLKQCDLGSDDLYHFYAVVMDASFPHKSFKSDRYICTLKIADPEQPIDGQGVVEPCTLVLFAKRFEDLPISQRVGDIIRVHRAYAGVFKGSKQFTANIFFNSSWALFSPVKKGEYIPFSYYGKTFTFEKSEQKIINSYREWVTRMFGKHQMLSSQYITKLSEASEQGKKRDNGKYYDIDLQVKVVQMFKLDDYSSEVRVVDDANQIWFCQVLNMKFRWLREGQYVRIRAATLEHHDRYERTFGLKSYSNILSLPYPSLLAKNMKLDYEPEMKSLDRELL